MTAAARQKTIRDALGRDPVHPFPARMAPDVALEHLRPTKRPLRVLDPMMGSGTVVALARSNKHLGYGVDIDPLANLIANVWTTAIDAKRVRAAAERVLRRAIINSDTVALRNAYPDGANEATRKFIRYWFDSQARRQLTALSRSIRAVRHKNIRNLLWCAFSRLIIAKRDGASLALDLAHSRPHRYFTKAPVKPFDKFQVSVEFVLKNTILKGSAANGPRANVRKGDARKLLLKKNSIDLVLTSPPYLNAIDYIRCSKFSLVWMGHNVDNLSIIRKRSIGTEVGRKFEEDKEISAIVKELKIRNLSDRYRAIVASYIDDMRLAIKEVSRVLVPGGSAVYVIGENTIAGVYVRNAKIIISLARRSGLLLKSETRRILPPNRRYLPPPKRTGEAALDTRMRTEVVLRFRKPKARAT
jgi:DNA modification methylase